MTEHVEGQPPKPTLQQIAEMPFPQSAQAMRKHYNPDWGKDIGDGIKRSYRCEVNYAIRGSEVVDVEAFTKDEAEDKASATVYDDLASKGFSDFDIDIEDATAREVEQ